MTALTLSIAKGAMGILSNGGGRQILEDLGILPDELELVKQDISWTGNNRVSVTRTIDSLMYGTMDCLGLPRFEVPAEYIAAAIVQFCHPINYMVACRWMEGGSRTQDLANAGGPNAETPGERVERIGSAQLFSLVLQLHNDGQAQTARAQFERNVDRKIKQQELQTKNKE